MEDKVKREEPKRPSERSYGNLLFPNLVKIYKRNLNGFTI